MVHLGRTIVGLHGVPAQQLSSGTQSGRRTGRGALLHAAGEITASHTRTEADHRPKLSLAP